MPIILSLKKLCCNFGLHKMILIEEFWCQWIRLAWKWVFAPNLCTFHRIRKQSGVLATQKINYIKTINSNGNGNGNDIAVDIVNGFHCWEVENLTIQWGHWNHLKLVIANVIYGGAIQKCHSIESAESPIPVTSIVGIPVWNSFHSDDGKMLKCGRIVAVLLILKELQWNL